MLELGGSFETFMQALVAFLNQFLSGLFEWLTSLLGGINVNFP